MTLEITMRTSRELLQQLQDVLAVVVGIVSGLYLAWRAARIDPIDALRYK